jgi:hypothetical protein
MAIAALMEQRGGSAMEFVIDRSALHVEIIERDCDIPTDERTRMQEAIERIATAVEGLAPADLRITVIFHDTRPAYHAEAKLKLPGCTIKTGDWDPLLDVAFQRSMRKLLHKIETYREQPDENAVALAQERAADLEPRLGHQEPQEGPVGEAARAGDYRKFRRMLADYEDWLRDRAGRWVQRYPDLNAEIDRGLTINDIVEETYLNAFEHYDERPGVKPLRDWLDDWIDPSLQALVEHPDETRQNASFARTVSEMNKPR